ncbi:MAG: hypothetical protein ACKVJK_00440 [Methylophagaceae bacterium]|jgi:hypothetical protein|tara:strand:+ start:358 stop:882 length:525 start_codon:yes stop_codon:yes gene_type:complete
MRYIRRQSTNARGLVGKGVNYTVDDEVRLDSAKAVLVPKGSTAERPTYPTNGHLRYNTDTNAFEQYEADSWRGTRYAEPVRVGIKVQTLGLGDASEQFFGVLDSGDINFPIPVAPQNVLVFVENVFQLPSNEHGVGGNYDVIQNPAGKPAGWYIYFSEAPPVGKPVTVIHNFDK